MSKDVLKLALEAFSVIAIADNLDWIRHKAEQQATAIKQALATPVQEPDGCRHIGEQDCLLDVDEKAWRSLVENREDAAVTSRRHAALAQTRFQRKN